MALTRKMLKAMGIEDEKVDQIIEEHVESVDGLKAERDRYRAGAEEAEGLRKQLEEAKAAGEGAGEYEEKYKAKCKEFDDYKAKVDGEAAEREKRGLYRKLLEDAGIDPKRVDTVLKVSDLSKVSVKDGAIEGAEGIADGIKTEWADFIATTSTKGAPVPTPPKGDGGAAAPKNLREALHQRYDNKE
ncbi:Clp protease N-terminal domain-containing protein [Parolsenella catena]|uniref:phage scaffolding protein n=1 Tax=Parolsenella catena TaxID=2003188 RepID=UPI003077AFC3